MFKFNDISTSDMSIVVEEPQSLLVRAPQKVDSIQIDGRSDEYETELGFTPVDITLKMYLLEDYKLDEVKQWLLGNGNLIYEGRVTRARFDKELDPIRTSGIKIFDISLKRSPFWYKDNDSFEEVTMINSQGVIMNEGTYRSQPIIKLTKKLNDVIFTYNFKHGDHVIIDCREMEASENTLSRNRNLEIGFLFPYLLVGSNMVEMLDGDCKVEFMRKDCWI